MKVFVTRQIPESGIALLKERGCQLTINTEDRVLTKAELMDYLKKDRYDAVLCLLTDKIDADIFDAAGEQCKIFANYAVGVDNIDLAEARKRGILITNTPGVLTEAVAEHTVALLFAAARRIVESDEYVRNGKFKGWAPKLFLGADIKGKTLGIIGLGRIGSEVARRMRDGFDLKIVYYDLTRNEKLEKEYGIDYRELDNLLKEADFVSLHVNLTEQTRHLIDAKKLKLMKPTAYLINTARGPVIDEKALVEALKKNVIAGAALDVFENEPSLTPGLADLENAILTPHIASATKETREKMSEMAAQNIIEALEGRTPPNPVN